MRFMWVLLADGVHGFTQNFIGNQIYSNDTGFRTCPEMDHFCTRCLHAQQHSFLGVVDGWLTSLRQQRWNQRDG